MLRGDDAEASATGVCCALSSVWAAGTGEKEPIVDVGFDVEVEAMLEDERMLDDILREWVLRRPFAFASVPPRGDVEEGSTRGGHSFRRFSLVSVLASDEGRCSESSGTKDRRTWHDWGAW